VRDRQEVHFSLHTTPLAAEAQPARKVHRVGVLLYGDPRSPSAWFPTFFTPFRESLRKRGWVEGQNVTIEVRNAMGNLDRRKAMAAELVRLNVDVIVALTAGEALVAQKATKTIPIVMVFGTDPVGLGLALSLAHLQAADLGHNGSSVSREPPELRLRLLQPEPHVHLAVHRLMATARSCTDLPCRAIHRGRQLLRGARRRQAGQRDRVRAAAACFMSLHAIHCWHRRRGIVSRDPPGAYRSWSFWASAGCSSFSPAQPETAHPSPGGTPRPPPCCAPRPASSSPP
jgi:ABC transporter substrate binding protein